MRQEDGGNIQNDTAMFIRILNRISLFLILAVSSNKLYSQGDTCFLGNLPEYRIVNENLSHFLDSIIPAISSMDVYAVFNTEIFVTIFIEDTNRLIISISPNSCTQFNRTALSRNDTFNGYLYIKNHLVIIAMLDYKFAKLFVAKTQYNRKIFVPNDENLMHHVVPVGFAYFFNINNGSINIEEGSHTGSYGGVFIYKIKAGDTWEKLVKKFHCLEADLKFDVENEKLIINSLIHFEFYVDDDKKVHVERIF